jgi:hypothetical protein
MNAARQSGRGGWQMFAETMNAGMRDHGSSKASCVRRWSGANSFCITSRGWICRATGLSASRHWSGGRA